METWSPGDRPVLLGGNLYSKNRWRLRWCVGATGAERVWVCGHRPRHHRSNHQRNDTANELDPRPVCLAAIRLLIVYPLNTKRKGENEADLIARRAQAGVDTA